MIIGITGLIGSGKDTVANYLTTFHGYKKISFASSLKDAVASVFGWDRELLEGATKSSREWRDQIDTWWADRLDIPDLTPRLILQHWGTEVCRQGFHNDIWVASVEHKLMNSQEDIVITDCRFINEIDGIKFAGGKTVRVYRGPQPIWYDDAVEANQKPNEWTPAKNRLMNQGIHASEYSSVGLEYDIHLDNNGTIDELHKAIELIING